MHSIVMYSIELDEYDESCINGYSDIVWVYSQISTMW